MRFTGELVIEIVAVAISTRFYVHFWPFDSHLTYIGLCIPNPSSLHAHAVDLYKGASRRLLK